MRITAKVHNEKGLHQIRLTTNDQTHSINISPKSEGRGSSANGGEMLFLALATCYCNDIYREAAREGLDIVSVSVEVAGAFGGVGQPARDVVYHARVKARGTTETDVHNLLIHTDSVAEVQNTLRQGVDVRLASSEVEILP